MSISVDIYQFTLRVREGDGERIEVTITSSGKIEILKREASFNTYPECLAKGTLIDTPSGPVPVEQLYKGMTAWTTDKSGKRIVAVVVETTAIPVPAYFQIINLTLTDGRSITASATHPTTEGLVLGDYQVGDAIDGTIVERVEYLLYDNGKTYDILPSGETGLYWANGILLKSTLPTN